MSQPVRVLLAGALYLLAVELGVALEHAEGATTFRASAGVGLAVVLLWGYLVLPSIFVVQLAVGLLRGSPFVGALAVAVASTLSAFAGACAIRKIVGQAGRFDRVSDVLALLAAAVITTALCPTIALTLQAFSGIDSWDGFAARRVQSRARGFLRGRGIGQYLEVTAAPRNEMGGVRFEADGTVTIITGTLDYGQGHASPFAQVLCDRLGVPFERVRLLQGDSDQLIAGGGTGGSKSMMASGAQMKKALTGLRFALRGILTPRSAACAG